MTESVKQQQSQNPQQQSAARHQHVDMPVGEILRRARLHYGLSLPDVEQALRIRASQLEALELMDTSRLPGRVYAIGFLRTYSEFLGLDGDQMVHLFKAQVVDGGARQPALQFPVSASESKVPNIYVVAASLAALIIFVGVVLVFSLGGNDAGHGENAVAPVTAMDAASGGAGLGEAPLQAAVAAAIQPAAGKEMSGQLNGQGQAVYVEPVVIKINDSVWIEVKNGKGKTLISRVMNKGDQYVVPSDEGEMTLSTGNAGGLSFVVNGKILPPFGEKGDVLRNIKLTPANLLTQAGYDLDAGSAGDNAAQIPSDH